MQKTTTVIAYPDVRVSVAEDSQCIDLRFIEDGRKVGRTYLDIGEAREVRRALKRAIRAAEGSSEAVSATAETIAETRVTESTLAAAFTEWDRRYREEPERFQAEARRLLTETPEQYGDSAAPYLLALLNGEI